MSFTDKEFNVIKVGDILFRVRAQKGYPKYYYSARWQIFRYEVLKISYDESGSTVWVAKERWDDARSNKLIAVSEYSKDFFVSFADAALWVHRSLSKDVEEWEGIMKANKVKIPTSP